MSMQPRPDDGRELRRGWTTGACATAASKAALALLATGSAPDPVEITLPRGQTPAFALALEEREEGRARVGIVKDAGDDPDVTHGALIVATVRWGEAGGGIRFEAGDGVGTITRPGLPLPPGEPAINPVPRRMITEAIRDLAQSLGCGDDVAIEISVPGGAKLAEKTWNPRLGIVGGISILGTTGIVHPFSCSAWIHSIHRGIDVARAMGLDRIAGCTGSTSEAAVQKLFDLPEMALVDMGDFVGGMLKYLRRHPIETVVVGGGFAKLCKLAQGYLDLHSGRSQVDLAWLAEQARGIGADDELAARIDEANTAAEARELCAGAGVAIEARIAELANAQATLVLRGAPVRCEVVVVSRQGEVLAHAR